MKLNVKVEQLELVPLTVNIATAISEGFWQCLTCLSIETEIDDNELRRCQRCHSRRVKFNPGIGR